MTTEFRGPTRYILRRFVISANYRTPDGTWDISTCFSMEEVVVLQSMGEELNMTDIYRLAEGTEERDSSDN